MLSDKWNMVAAYANNEINSEKKLTKPMRDFQLSLGEHLLQLTTFLSAPKILI